MSLNWRWRDKIKNCERCSRQFFPSRKSQKYCSESECKHQRKLLYNRVYNRKQYPLIREEKNRKLTIKRRIMYLEKHGYVVKKLGPVDEDKSKV